MYWISVRKKDRKTDFLWENKNKNKNSKAKYGKLSNLDNKN